MLRLTTVVLTLSLAVPLSLDAQQLEKKSGDGMTAAHGKLLTWAPLDRPGFRPGILIAVLAGDPGKEGTYTLRLQLPAGYRFPAHIHPNTENVTVISGKFLVGMGDKTDIRKLSAYEPGDYLNIPAGMAHFGGADAVTVIQLHGNGPFATTVLEQLPGASTIK